MKNKIKNIIFSLLLATAAAVIEELFSSRLANRITQKDVTAPTRTHRVVEQIKYKEYEPTRRREREVEVDSDNTVEMWGSASGGYGSYGTSGGSMYY